MRFSFDGRRWRRNVFAGLRVVRGKARKCVPGSHRQAILYNVYYDSSVIWWNAGFSLWIIIFTLCNIAKKNYWRKSFSSTCFCVFLTKTVTVIFFDSIWALGNGCSVVLFWSSTCRTKKAQRSSRSPDRKEHPRVFTRDAGGMAGIWNAEKSRAIRFK